MAFRQERSDYTNVVSDVREMTFKDIIDEILKPAGVKVGGFPEEMFTDLSETETEQYSCNICFLLVNECRQCMNKHKFCRTCVLAWSMTIGENSKKCPLCRCEQQEYLSNREVDKTLGDKRVRCLESGCSFQAPLRIYLMHCHGRMLHSNAGVDLEDVRMRGQARLAQSRRSLLSYVSQSSDRRHMSPGGWMLGQMMLLMNLEEQLHSQSEQLLDSPGSSHESGSTGARRARLGGLSLDDLIALSVQLDEIRSILSIFRNRDRSSRDLEQDPTVRDPEQEHSGRDLGLESYETDFESAIGLSLEDAEVTESPFISPVQNTAVAESESVNVNSPLQQNSERNFAQVPFSRQTSTNLAPSIEFDAVNLPLLQEPHCEETVALSQLDNGVDIVASRTVVECDLAARPSARGRLSRSSLSAESAQSSGNVRASESSFLRSGSVILSQSCSSFNTVANAGVRTVTGLTSTGGHGRFLRQATSDSLPSQQFRRISPSVSENSDTALSRSVYNGRMILSPIAQRSSSGTQNSFTSLEYSSAIRTPVGTQTPMLTPVETQTVDMSDCGPIASAEYNEPLSPISAVGSGGLGLADSRNLTEDYSSVETTRKKVAGKKYRNGNFVKKSSEKQHLDDMSQVQEGQHGNGLVEIDACNEPQSTSAATKSESKVIKKEARARQVVTVGGGANAGRKLVPIISPTPATRGKVTGKTCAVQRDPVVQLRARRRSEITKELLYPNKKYSAK